MSSADCRSHDDRETLSRGGSDAALVYHEVPSFKDRLSARRKMSPMTTLKVLVERRANAQEIERIRSAFDSIGLPVEVDAGYEVKSVPTEPFATTILIATAIIFIKAFIDEAAKDAYRGVRKVAGKALGTFMRQLATSRDISRRNPPGLWIKPEDGSPDLMLPPDLPDEAYVALFEVDFDAVDGSLIGWDRDTQRWVVLNHEYHSPPLLPPEDDEK